MVLDPGKLPVRGVLLVCIILRQGRNVLAVGAVAVVRTIFLSLVIVLFFYPFSGSRSYID